MRSIRSSESPSLVTTNGELKKKNDNKEWAIQHTTDIFSMLSSVVNISENESPANKSQSTYPQKIN